MCKGLGTISKTLRLPEDVVAVIESFPGDTFTEKFVACSRLLGRDRTKLEGQVKELTWKRQRLLREISDLSVAEQKLRKVSASLTEVNQLLSTIRYDCVACRDVVERSSGVK